MLPFTRAAVFGGRRVFSSVAAAAGGGGGGGGRLAGKVAVVTGGSSGIGEGIARALAAEGARVAIAARRADDLNKARERLINEVGVPASSCIAVPTDVTKREEVGNLVAAAAREFGSPVDIMANVAGVMSFTRMAACEEQVWQRMVDANINGVLHGIGAVLPSMVERGSGHIVNVSSDGARRMFPYLAVYCASKAFVQQLGEGLRRELLGTGIRVSDIQPGDVATNLVTNSGIEDSSLAEELGVETGKKVGEGWANKWNVMQPEDVAAAVVYAVTAPPHVAVNEILVEPRDQL